jgi:predicted transglutaminase-like cysteine proteinase
MPLHPRRFFSGRKLPNRPFVRLVVLCLGLALFGHLAANWDMGRILALVESHGALGSAQERLQAWAQLLQNSSRQPEQQQLETVNRFFNQQLGFRDDLSIWGVVDYWATPVEALTKGAGDCEDFALAKYFSLRQLGVPAERLRITYVKSLKLNQAHMVLSYYISDSSDPLVLDNLIGQILPASQRHDLLPVYAFNAEGLFLIDPFTGAITRGDPKQLSRWQGVLKKMRNEGFNIGEG